MIWKITRRKHNVVFVFGKQAKVLREMLGSAVVPDRTTLEKEADEFEQYMLRERRHLLAVRNGSTKVLFAIKIAKTH
mgnify:CR=1 FL=1